MRIEHGPEAFKKHEEQIVQAMRLASRGSKFVAGLADVGAIADACHYGNIPSVVIGDQVLLLYSVDYPWFSPKSIFLEELMVLRFAPGDVTFREIVEAMDFLADCAGADGILSGGALSEKPRSLAAAYKRYGFREEDSPQLIKWRQTWA